MAFLLHRGLLSQARLSLPLQLRAQTEESVPDRCLRRAETDGVVTRISDVNIARAIDRHTSWRIKACVDSSAVRGARAQR